MDNNGNNSLSPEEKEAQQIFHETTKKIQALENEIKNLPPDKGPTLELRFTGMPPNRPFGTKAQREQDKKKEIETLKVNAGQHIEKLMGNSTPGIQQKLAKQFDEWQNPREKTLREKLADIKNLEKSQEAMKGLITEKKQSLKENGQTNSEEKKEEKQKGKVGAKFIKPTIANVYSLKFSYFGNGGEESTRSPNNVKKHNKDKERE